MRNRSKEGRGDRNKEEMTYQDSRDEETKNWRIKVWRTSNGVLEEQGNHKAPLSLFLGQVTNES